MDGRSPQAQAGPDADDACDDALIVLAAGRGRRAGGPVPKQYAELEGPDGNALPVLVHTLNHLAAAFVTSGATALPRLVIVIRPEDRPLFEARIRTHLPTGWAAELVEGGAERALSVRAGLEALAQRAPFPRHVFIHDGARPFVGRELIAALQQALADHQGAAPALPLTDALWRGTGGKVVADVPRAGLFRAQTPQAFAFTAILAAHRANEDATAADDVAVARAHGIEVAITPGSEDNIKITHGQDFARARRILVHFDPTGGERVVLALSSNSEMTTMPGHATASAPATSARHEPPMRVGHGFDVHAFTTGDRVILGGVAIPFEKALAGHSDADVVLHALADAIYGALAEGDIGRHFPPSEAKWKAAASDIFLSHAADLVRQRGYRIANLDVTAICEAPKIGPHAAAMAGRIAEICAISPGQVSVKATTSERLGFTGRGEGIAAMATALLLRE